MSDGRQTNGVVPLRFFVAANSIGVDVAIHRLSGRKNNHQQVDPGSGVRRLPSQLVSFFCFDNFPKKLPVLCLEFQNI